MMFYAIDYCQGVDESGRTCRIFHVQLIWDVSHPDRIQEAKVAVSVACNQDARDRFPEGSVGSHRMPCWFSVSSPIDRKLYGLVGKGTDTAV